MGTPAKHRPDPIERSYNISRAKRAFYQTEKGQKAKEKIGAAQAALWKIQKQERSQAISAGLKRHYQERREEAARKKR